MTAWEATLIKCTQRLREACGMTQTDLARALKQRGLPFHQQTIQRIENGDRPIRLNEAFLIAEVFGVELWALTATQEPAPDIVDALTRAATAEAKLARIESKLTQVAEIIHEGNSPDQ